MPEVELSAGTIEYQDTGGDGPVLVFLHGLTMDGSLWRKIAQILIAQGDTTPVRAWSSPRVRRSATTRRARPGR